MNKQDLKNLAGDIKCMIRDFVNTGDLRKVGRDVGNTVGGALDMAFEEVRKAISSIQAEVQRNDGKNTAQVRYNNRQEENRGQTDNSWQAQQKQQKTVAAFPHRPVGRVAGILYTVFGGLGVCLLGIAAAVTAYIVNVLGRAVQVIPAVAFFSAFFIGSVALEIKGSVIRGRLKRYRKYVKLLEGRSSCMIRELSAYSGYSERFILRDFRKMIALGMFPQAHVDDEKTLLMLNNEAYKNYLAYQAEYRARKTEDQRKRNAEGKKAKESEVRTNVKAGPEVQKAIDEGKKYLRQIHEAKSEIQDAEVSEKVRCLEDTVSRIIGHIEEHPEALPEARRLMAYYLPTTVKLLGAYGEFDRQPIQGENIRKAKTEIKEALDTINLAFGNLFDSFFEDAARDISAEISVLNTLLAQEGLTEKDFKARS